MKWQASGSFNSDRSIRNHSASRARRWRAAVTALMLLFAAIGAQAQQSGYPDPEGTLAVRVCMTCHGAYWQGSEVVGGPALAGMEPWYLRRQLQNFRAGLRGNHKDYVPAYEMRAAALVLSDADIDTLATTLAAVPPQAAQAVVSGDVGHGRELYQGCAACHGLQAEGNELLAAPALAGRNDWYLLKQLRLFASGKRGAHPDDIYGAQMRSAGGILVSDADRSDVLAFIGTLQ